MITFGNKAYTYSENDNQLPFLCWEACPKKTSKDKMQCIECDLANVWREKIDLDTNWKQMQLL
jgi:hypothetical protein